MTNMLKWQNRFRLFSTPYFDTLSLEMFLAFATTTWGLRMFFTTGAVSSSPGLWWLSYYGDHRTFGIVAMTIGAAKFGTMRLGGLYVLLPAMLAFMWWTFYSVGLYSGNPSSAGVAIYGTFAVANLFILGFSETRDG